MGAYEFVIQALSTLAWPVVVLILVLVLKGSIRSLITRFTEGEFPGVKVKFVPVEKLGSSDVNRIEASSSFVRELTTDGRNLGGIGPHTDENLLTLVTFYVLRQRLEVEARSVLQNAYRVASSNPTAAALSAGSVVKTQLHVLYILDYYARYSREVDRPQLHSGGLEQLEHLRKHDSLDEQSYRSIKQIIEFRSELVIGATCDLDSAGRYLDAAQEEITGLLFSIDLLQDRRVARALVREIFDWQIINSGNQVRPASAEDKSQEDTS